MKKETLKIDEIWENVVTTFESFAVASAQFITYPNHIEILKKALVGKKRQVALYLIKDLSLTDVEACFDELVFLSSFSHGSIGEVRKILLSLPRDFTLKRIEGVVEPILQSGTYDEYRNILELYKNLDVGLMQQLALRASQNADNDIKEVGNEYLH